MKVKATLVDWIHRVELDQKKNRLSKRLPSIVSELFFENALSTRLELDLPLPLAFGWTYKQSRNDGRRTWFKMSERKHPSASLRFIKAVKDVNVDDDFFLIEPDVGFDEGFPTIAWKVRELSVLPHGGVGRHESLLAEGFEHQIKSRVDEALRSRRSVTIDREAPTISSWLLSLSDSTLERLFATRCLMNFADLYLSDVDAVGVNAEGRVELLEFKRKDPAMGARYKPLRQPSESTGLDLHLSRIGMLKGMNLDAVKRRLTEGGEWSVISSDPAFGLDTSHVRTVELCERAGIRYRYLIWYSSARQARDLLTHEWKPVDDIDLRVIDLTEDAFDGLTCTDGVDSGSYNNGVRFQLAIPVRKFAAYGISRQEF